MNNKGAMFGAILAILACGGCGPSHISALPAGEAAYTAIPPVAQDATETQLIQPGDRLNIRVFGEPELSSDQYRVDAFGFLQLPLAGEIMAAQRKPSELRDEITRRLGARYLREPNVIVAIAERLRSNYAVEGQVREPGVFEARPGTTLLAALATAKSPTNTAKLDEIAILRMVNGQRVAARFDLQAIRGGQAPDPQILAGDIVVVGFSQGKGLFRDFLQAAPLFNLFYLFNN
jgi:polysaccharide export outer membrane protein